MRQAAWLIALVVSAAGAAHAQSAAPALSGDRIAAVVQRARDMFAPAGLAVAVVQDGAVTWRGAFGERRVGSGEPVTPSTPFVIASMTKAFTAAALAILVDEGRLRWDDPVIKYLPTFALADPYVTRSMTVRDLLVHRSGLALGAGDLLSWPDGRWTPADVMAALPHLPLDHGFRDRFVYDNTLYIVAGEVVRAASGLDWATFVRQRVLDPLQMRECAPLSGLPGEAHQHARASAAAPPRPLDIAALTPDPAGSIVCSVNDLTRWAHLHLSGGLTSDGRRLISEQSMRDLHTGVTPMRPAGLDRRLGRTHLQLYALGWTVFDFKGHLALAHSGGAPGSTADMLLIPERRVAVIVLANDQVPLPPVLTRQLADAIISGDTAAADWLADTRRRWPPADNAQETDQAPAHDGTPLITPLAAHAGEYRDPWYGRIDVRFTEGGPLTLHLTRSALLKGPLVPLGGARFLARWPDRTLQADAIVTFTYDDSGEVTGFSMRAASEHTDFSYDYHHLAPVKVRAGAR
jgi:CubicO group peptidase (beta-lactamase class C family)